MFKQVEKQRCNRKIFYTEKTNEMSCGMKVCGLFKEAQITQCNGGGGDKWYEWRNVVTEAKEITKSMLM